MARRSNLINQLLIEIKGLSHNFQGINSNFAILQRNGHGILGQMNHPYNLNNLTSTQFWSDVISRQDKVRMQALGINTNTQALAAGASAGIGKAGFNNAVTNQLELLTTGLNSSLEATKDLGLEMKVTGQSEAKLYQTMRQSQIIGATSNKSIENLSQHMMSLSHTYQISNDALVEAMSKIATNPDVAVLGKTEEFSKLNMDIAAKFGAGMQMHAENIESMYAAGQTFNQDAMLGLQDLAGGMGKSLEDFKAYVKIYSTNVADYLKQFPRTMEAVGLNMAKGIFGQQSIEAYLLNKRFEQGENAPGGSENKFATLNTALETLYTPIEKLASDLLPSLIKSMGVLTAAYVAAQGGSMIAQGFGSIMGIVGMGASVGLMELLPVLIPILAGAAVIGGGIWLLVNALSDNSEEQTKAARESLELEKRRDFDERAKAATQTDTAKYMQLQSQAITDSINMIIYNGDLSRRLASETDKRKIELSERLLAAIHKMDRVATPSKPNNIAGQAR